MKFFTLIAALFITVGAFAQLETVKILTVGNSFSNDATAYLPEMFKAGKKNFEVLRLASLGGHSLAQHLGYAEAAEADPFDPKGRPYVGKKQSLQEILQSRSWNFITIQQVSAQSPFIETYEPAEKLVAIIKKYAPKAEVVMQETWSYRSDSKWLAEKKMTEKEMYDKLHAAYTETANKLGIRLIPTGTAFQAALNDPLWGFKLSDKDPKTLKPGESKGDYHSLQVGYAWRKNKDTGVEELKFDPNHSSIYGRFLGAAVWYEFFCGDVEANTFVPKGINPEEAHLLRKIAAETVRNMKK